MGKSRSKKIGGEITYYLYGIFTTATDYECHLIFIHHFFISEIAQCLSNHGEVCVNVVAIVQFYQ
jgi:hypothetical protein